MLQTLLNKGKVTICFKKICLKNTYKCPMQKCAYFLNEHKIPIPSATRMFLVHCEVFQYKEFSYKKDVTYSRPEHCSVYLSDNAHAVYLKLSGREL